MGRGILIIAVRLGQDPYGFFGKFQALNWDQKNLEQLAQLIAKILATHEKTARTMAEILVSNVEKTNSWERSRLLGKLMLDVTYWSDSLSERCRAAIQNNSYVNTSFTLPGQINARIRAFETPRP